MDVRAELFARLPQTVVRSQLADAIRALGMSEQDGILSVAITPEQVSVTFLDPDRADGICHSVVWPVSDG
jgi:hypothetical protein